MEPIDDKTICPLCGRRRNASAGDDPRTISPDPVASRLLDAVFEPHSAQDSSVSETGSTASPSAEPGSLPGYRIASELGRGGMGIVYRATQLAAERDVALKVLHSTVIPDATVLDRFREEVRAIGMLDHPGIVPLLDVGSWAGHPFFAMGLVRGESLARRIQTGSVDFRHGARIVATVTRAVAHAHSRGIVHRDLKPSNILLTEDGEPRVTDFGLAKRLDGAAPDLTRTGQILGTPSYLAPECIQSGGASASPSVDIYALGAVLYHVLAMRPPFYGETNEAVLAQVLGADPVLLRRWNPAIPEDLEAICFRCLEKDPRRRYKSADDLASDLERFLDGREVVARPLRASVRFWRFCRRRPAIASLAAALGLTLIAGSSGVLWAWRKAVAERTATESARADLERAQLLAKRLLDRSRFDHATDLLRRGAWTDALPILARMVRENPSNPAATARLLDLLEWNEFPRLIRPPFVAAPDINQFAFDPSRARIAVASSRGFARVFDVTTGEPLSGPLLHDKSVLGVAFSPDGSWIATSSPDETARVWDAATGRAVGAPLPHPGTSVERLAFTPGGRRLVTMGSPRPGHRGNLLRGWNLPEGTPTGPPHAFSHYVFGLEFSPDGRLLLVLCADRRAYLLHVTAGQVLHALEHGAAVLTGSFSSDGSRVTTGSADGMIRVWDTDSGRPLGAPLTLGSEIVRVRLANDGGRVLSGSKDGIARIHDATTGRQLSSVMASDGPLTDVRFDPEERRVLTLSEDGSARLWDAATGESWGAPVRHRMSVRAGWFLPDGRSLVTLSSDGEIRLSDVAERAQRPHRFACTSRPVDTVWAGTEPSFFTATEREMIGPCKPGTDPSAAPRNPWPRTLRGIRFPLTSEPPRALVWFDNHSMALWNAQGAGTIRNLDGYLSNDADPRFTPDGRWLATCVADGVRVFDTGADGSSSAFIIPSGPGEEIRALECSQDGRWLWIGYSTGNAGIWALASGEQRVSVRGVFSARTAAFRSDSSALAYATDSPAVRVIHPADGRELANLPSAGQVRLVSFGQRHLAIQAADRTVRLHDASDFHTLPVGLHHPSPVREIRWSRNDQALLALSEDQSVTLWSLDSERPVLGPWTPGARVVGLSFLPEGSRWIVATEDGGWMIRDTATGQMTGGPHHHGAPVTGAALAPDGKWMALTGKEGVVSVWSTGKVPDSAPSWLPKLAEAIAAGRMDERDVLLPVEPWNWFSRPEAKTVPLSESR